MGAEGRGDGIRWEQMRAERGADGRAGDGDAGCEEAEGMQGTDGNAAKSAEGTFNKAADGAKGMLDKAAAWKRKQQSRER